MKWFFLVAIFCLHVQADVGVLGPGGKVTLYSKQNEAIQITKCEKNSVLGQTSHEAKKNCKGKIYLIPKHIFKNSLHDLITSMRKFQLRPVTGDEISAYLMKELPSSEEMEAMKIELAEIDAFIAAYGGKDAPLLRRIQLIALLRSREDLESAKIKIKQELTRTLQSIEDDTIIITKSSTDNEQFMFRLLHDFNPERPFPCGFVGTIEERTLDCSFQESSQLENYTVVARNDEQETVYQDSITGLLWIRRASVFTNFDRAKDLCSELNFIDGVRWSLPTLEQFREARTNGLSRVSKVMHGRFWIADSSSRPDLAYVFFLLTGPALSMKRDGANEVICVGN